MHSRHNVPIYVLSLLFLHMTGCVRGQSDDSGFVMGGSVNLISLVVVAVLGCMSLPLVVIGVSVAHQWPRPACLCYRVELSDSVDGCEGRCCSCSLFRTNLWVTFLWLVLLVVSGISRSLLRVLITVGMALAHGMVVMRLRKQFAEKGWPINPDANHAEDDPLQSWVFAPIPQVIPHRDPAHRSPTAFDIPMYVAYIQPRKKSTHDSSCPTTLPHSCVLNTQPSHQLSEHANFCHQSGGLIGPITTTSEDPDPVGSRIRRIVTGPSLTALQMSERLAALHLIPTPETPQLYNGDSSLNLHGVANSNLQCNTVRSDPNRHVAAAGDARFDSFSGARHAVAGVVEMEQPSTSQIVGNSDVLLAMGVPVAQGHPVQASTEVSVANGFPVSEMHSGWTGNHSSAEADRPRPPLSIPYHEHGAQQQQQQHHQHNPIRHRGQQQLQLDMQARPTSMPAAAASSSTSQLPSSVSGRDLRATLQPQSSSLTSEYLPLETSSQHQQGRDHATLTHNIQLSARASAGDLHLHEQHIQQRQASDELTAQNTGIKAGPLPGMIE